VLQLTSLLTELRGSAAWLSENTRLEFWKRCQQVLVEHNVSSVIAADFLQVYSTVRNCRFISIMIMIIIFLIPQAR